MKARIRGTNIELDVRPFYDETGYFSGFSDGYEYYRAADLVFPDTPDWDKTDWSSFRREAEREIFIEGYERAIKDAVELLKNGGTAPAVELPRWKKAEINDKGWRFYAGRCLYHDGYTLSLDELLALPKES